MDLQDEIKKPTPLRSGFVEKRIKRVMYCKQIWSLIILVSVYFQSAIVLADLIPADVRPREWVEFRSQGFESDVAGSVFEDGGQRQCGVPLGGLGTGYVSVSLDGNLGQWTIYNNLVNPVYGLKTEYGGTWVGIPRKIEMPFLGLSVDGQTTLLSLQKIGDLKAAKQVRYWGHYPVADLVYDLDVPLKVSLRGWSPFILGDVNNSNIPGAVFSVTVENASAQSKAVTLAMSIPSPEDYETGGRRGFGCRQVGGSVKGVIFTAERPGWPDQEGHRLKYGYCLGVIGDEKIRMGGPLLNLAPLWEKIDTALPQLTPDDAGSSVAVDVELAGGESKTISFVFAWYAPFWPATPYTNMYSRTFDGPLAAAEKLAEAQGSLLDRILAWQQVIYSENQLPLSLRDGLVNCLNIITKCSSYVSGPGVDKGLLAIMEATGCFLIQETICVAWWGDFPVTYFFPQLRKGTLLELAKFQDDAGRIPFCLGASERRLDRPNHRPQHVVNGMLYTQMADRVCQRLGTEEVVREFYPAIKRAIEYSMTLSIYKDGLISLDPDYATGQPWDGWHWKGNATYIAGHWLASLRIAQRMAQAVGDNAFAQLCQDWIKRGSASLEKSLWNEATRSYLLYNAPGTEFRSDVIFAYQLDGQFSSVFHGLDDVYPEHRRDVALKTINERLVKPIKVGAANGIRSDGLVDYTAGGADSAGIWPASNAILAATYAYEGQPEVAREILDQMLSNLHLNQQRLWDYPQGFYDQQGSRIRAGDYYWGMSLWAAPPALLGQNIKEICTPGGLIANILKAAK